MMARTRMIFGVVLRGLKGRALAELWPFALYAMALFMSRFFGADLALPAQISLLVFCYYAFARPAYVPQARRDLLRQYPTVFLQFRVTELLGIILLNFVLVIVLAGVLSRDLPLNAYAGFGLGLVGALVLRRSIELLGALGSTALVLCWLIPVVVPLTLLCIRLLDVSSADAFLLAGLGAFGLVLANILLEQHLLR